MNAVRKPAFELPPARILDVSDEEYFADPCAVPSLSQSIANLLVTESPRHAWLRHPRLGGVADEATKATTEGTMIHKLLLGQGADIVLIDAEDFRTNAAKNARDDAIAAGKLPVIRKKFEAIEEAATRLRVECARRGFSFTGESEVAVEWSEYGASGPVLCRGRMDHVFLDSGVIYDVKKTRNANPKYLAKHFVELGYDIQAAAYTRAVEALNPALQGRTDFVFLFMELEAPYSVVPARADGAMREIGNLRWSRAVHLWERCLSRGIWPSYCDEPITLSPPPWVLTEEIGNAP